MRGALGFEVCAIPGQELLLRRRKHRGIAVEELQLDVEIACPAEELPEPLEFSTDIVQLPWDPGVEGAGGGTQSPARDAHIVQGFRILAEARAGIVLA
jgi:hypothetical protein